RHLYSLFTAPSAHHRSPLSLHYALPISSRSAINWPLSCRASAETGDPLLGMVRAHPSRGCLPRAPGAMHLPLPSAAGGVPARVRSEEHTSELQSRENLVCRLLLEKKKLP